MVMRTFAHAVRQFPTDHRIPLTVGYLVGTTDSVAVRSVTVVTNGSASLEAVTLVPAPVVTWDTVNNDGAPTRAPVRPA
jgi:hypothetical protein